MSDNTVSEGSGMRRTPYYRPGGLSSTGSGDNSARLAALLADPVWRPSREQVADLIARAFRSGWELGRDETREELTVLNLGAIARAYAEPEFGAQAVAMAGRVREYRAAWDAEATLPRETDHPGGTVQAW